MRAHEPADEHGVEDGSLHQAELAVAREVGHVGPRTRGEVVEGCDPSAGLQKPVDQV